MEWFDQRLIWNASDFNGLSTLRLPCSKIWLPDIVLYNSADDYTQGYYQSKAMVDSTGHVFWPPPAKFRSSCKIDVTFFPFDDQLCKLKFGSWTYDAAQVNLTKRRDNVDMSNYIKSGEWLIINVIVKRNDVTYPCCPGIYYPDITIYVHIRRRILYYMFNIIFPCIWLSILSLLGFWLPPDSGEKITLGITVLLAFSVFMLLIAESMPATSEMVPLIEIYLTIVMGLTSLSIVLTVYVLQLHHSGPVVTRVPHHFKYTLVHIIAPIIGMHETVAIYANEHNLTLSDDVYKCYSKVKYSTRKRMYKKRLSTPAESDDEQSLRKETRVPVSNGNLRPNSHNIRQATPPILLIRPRSSSRTDYQKHSPKTIQNSNSSSLHHHLFNSNMYLLEKHLKHLIVKQQNEEERNEIINEWKLMALIMDRLLFWLFTFLTLLSSVLSLIIIPCLKNSGYIPALTKELVHEYTTMKNTLSSSPVQNETSADQLVERR
ncbi:unnamed protein product [Didymodactylos carnosus]|uniref:Uncharacterized protein n=1 Tax=Didymodactylos carnosus TaxID=1234261 RepID=A0A8S2SKJ0_9BILA|nr:unnamed protein product [Didymodactylos carnosus]CAF4234853.1 unnamed protein product [Didymodactylos carnosus]